MGVSPRGNIVATSVNTVGKGFRIMCRKIAVLGVAVLAGLFILKSTHLGSYARTAWGKVKESAQRQVPLEFQLESLRNEVAQLVPDVRKNCGEVAAEMVAVQNLRDEVGDLRKNFDKQKAYVRDMNSQLNSGVATVSFNGRSYPPERFRAKLERELETCKRCGEEVGAKEQLLEAKEKALEAARDRLASMKALKERFEVQIAQLEAEVRTFRLAESQSKIQIDDSRLARIKSQLSSIKDQLQVQKNTSDLMNRYDLEEKAQSESKPKTAAQLSKEVEEFLGSDAKEGTVAERR
jgi:DNA repair ATPase RecN